MIYHLHDLNLLNKLMYFHYAMTFACTRFLMYHEVIYLEIPKTVTGLLFKTDQLVISVR